MGRLDSESYERRQLITKLILIDREIYEITNHGDPGVELAQLVCLRDGVIKLMIKKRLIYLNILKEKL